MGDNKSEFQFLLNQIDNLQNSLSDIRDEMRYRHVSQNEFKPIKMLVYGLVGTVMSWLVVYALSNLF